MHKRFFILIGTFLSVFITAGSMEAKNVEEGERKPSEKLIVEPLTGMEPVDIQPGQLKTGPSMLMGPYLGQKPPGDVPELFAPGIVAQDEHSAAVFTPDGQEVFWCRVMNHDGSRRLCVVLTMKAEKGVWSRPELAPFNSWWFTFISSVSPDGKRLYIQSTRPKEPGGESIGWNYDWIIEKTGNGWGTPKQPGFVEKWNWDMRCSKFQETLSGNLYFTSGFKLGRNAIGLYRSKLVNGQYQRPEAMSQTINSPDSLDYAFHVSPDEKFVIFSSNRPGGFNGETDLYISYHLPDDSWSEAVNLGEKINKPLTGGADWPCLSPDGKYLFFTASVIPDYKIINKKDCTYADLVEISKSDHNGYNKVYWVGTGFVEKLKPRELQ